MSHDTSTEAFIPASHLPPLVGGHPCDGYTGEVNAKKCRAGARVALALSAIALVSGCATSPEPTCPGLSLVLDAGEPVYLDQFQVNLPFTLSILNPGREPARIESFEARLEIEGSRLEVETGQAGKMAIAGGKTEGFAFVVPVDLRRYGPAEAATGGRQPGAGPEAVIWTLEGLARIRLGDGRLEEIGVSTKGSFVPVREPVFRILSIRIERDLLVTTSLKLMLEIGNPNAFPVRLDGLDWELAGEGRFWAGGRSEEVLEVPAGGLASRGIAFEMNFANMDRRLFDLVAKLREVRYRFSGKATIASDRDGIPAFVTAFDEAGSCAVER